MIKKKNHLQLAFKLENSNDLNFLRKTLKFDDYLINI